MELLWESRNDMIKRNHIIILLITSTPITCKRTRFSWFEFNESTWKLTSQSYVKNYATNNNSLYHPKEQWSNSGPNKPENLMTHFSSSKLRKKHLENYNKSGVLITHAVNLNLIHDKLLITKLYWSLIKMTLNYSFWLLYEFFWVLYKEFSHPIAKRLIHLRLDWLCYCFIH